jgi:hypothetical protein
VHHVLCVPHEDVRILFKEWSSTYSTLQNFTAFNRLEGLKYKTWVFPDEYKFPAWARTMGTIATFWGPSWVRIIECGGRCELVWKKNTFFDKKLLMLNLEFPSLLHVKYKSSCTFLMFPLIHPWAQPYEPSRADISKPTCTRGPGWTWLRLLLCPQQIYQLYSRPRIMSRDIAEGFVCNLWFCHSRNQTPTSSANKSVSPALISRS